MGAVWVFTKAKEDSIDLDKVRSKGVCAQDQIKNQARATTDGLLSPAYIVVCRVLGISTLIRLGWGGVSRDRWRRGGGAQFAPCLLPEYRSPTCTRQLLNGKRYVLVLLRPHVHTSMCGWPLLLLPAMQTPAAWRIS